MAQNTRCDVRKCLLGVHTMADNILAFIFPKNRQKWPSISMFERPRTDSKRMTSHKTDVIGLPAVCTRLFIVSGKLLWLCILQYLQRNDSVSYGTEIQFLLNLYSICRSSVLQVGAKKDAICGLLESFKNC